MSSRGGAPVKPPSSAPATLGAPPPDASSSQTYPQDPPPPPPIAHSHGSQLGWGSVGSAPISDCSRRALSLTGAPPSYNPSVRDVAGRHRSTAFDSYTCDFRSVVDAAATIPVFSLSSPTVGLLCLSASLFCLFWGCTSCRYCGGFPPSAFSSRHGRLGRIGVVPVRSFGGFRVRFKFFGKIGLRGRGSRVLTFTIYIQYIRPPICSKYAIFTI